MIGIDFWLSPLWWSLSFCWTLVSLTFSVLSSPTIVPKRVTEATGTIIKRHLDNIGGHLLAILMFRSSRSKSDVGE